MTRAHRFATALVGKARAMLHRLGPKATIACAYGAIAIFTFGHSASAEHVCRAENDTVRTCRVAPVAMSSLVAGVLWPLYWSWEVQS